MVDLHRELGQGDSEWPDGNRFKRTSPTVGSKVKKGSQPSPDRRCAGVTEMRV